MLYARLSDVTFRYCDPILVSLPSLLRNAALAPTLEFCERNAPKYEYRSMKSELSK